MHFKRSFLATLVVPLVAAAPTPSLQLKRTTSPIGAADLAPRFDASAVINNGCPFEIYVQQDVNGHFNPEETAIPAGSSFTFPSPPNGSPIGLFVGEASGTINGALVLEYTVQDSQRSTLYYDISIDNGNPFAGNGLQLVTTDPTCPTINCPVGDGDCGSNHQEEQCSDTAQLQLLLCQPA